MVAQNWDQMTTILKLDEIVKDAFRIDATINIVAQSDNGIVRFGRNLINDCFESKRTTVDITDSNGSWQKEVLKSIYRWKQKVNQ